MSDPKNNQIEEEEEEPEKLLNLGSLNSKHYFNHLSFIVSQLIKSSQSSNGLKHQDYNRYRKYCVQRVKRIRKQMKFSYGKRYAKKNIIKERQVNTILINYAHKNDPKLLHVLLYNAEKNWAYAMYLKAQSNLQVGRNRNPKRMKFHLRKKFKRAVLYAKLLQQTCTDRTDQQTALEAQSYCAFLEGMYYFEIEKWDEAQSAFMTCRSIYTEIIKVSDSMQAVLYKEKLEQIDQSIRYCSYRSKKQSSLMTMENLLDLKQQIKDPSLAQKIEEMLEVNRQKQLEQSAGLLEVEYHGDKIPIKNSKVILVLEKAKELLYNIDQNQEKVENLIKTDKDMSQVPQILELQEQNLELYISLFSQYDEALKFTNKDKDDPQNSEAEKNIFVNVISYLNLQRLFAVLNRNSIHVNYSVYKFFKENGIQNIENLSTKKAIKLKLTTPQEIVKYCDNYQQVLKQIMEIERLNPDLSMFKKLDVYEFNSKAIRCFFVGSLYYCNGKYQEAVSLLKYAEDLFKITIRKYQENIKLFKFESLDTFLQQLINNLPQLCLQCKLNSLKEQSKNSGRINIQMEQLTLEDNQKQEIQQTLYELMIQKSQKINDINMNNILEYKGVDLSERMKLLSCKPIFFDIAFSYLLYPELEDKKQGQKGGFWNKWNIFKK